MLRTFEDCEASDRPLTALASNHPHDSVVPPHNHHRAQLIHSLSGIMTVTSSAGNWVVPTGKAVWMPTRAQHQIRMAGNVQMRTIYVSPDARPGLSTQCEVIDVSPLLREAIVAATAIPLNYAREGRDNRVMELILDELAIAPRLSMYVPLPADARLAAICQQLIAEPSRMLTIDELAANFHLSGRTLARQFEREIGMTIGAWRRRMCLLLSLPRLAAGASILEVALEAGYDSPSAFTAMFKRELGMAPTSYISRQE